MHGGCCKGNRTWESDEIAAAKRSKTDVRQKAQDELLRGVARVLGYWDESPPWGDMTEDEQDEYREVLQQQADRIAKMFGYDKAWTA